MNKAAICTDSLSLIQAMQNKSMCTKNLRHKLHTLSSNINMLLKWVPGHKNIPGNEMADQYARIAAVYKNLNRKRDSAAVKSRKDGALLAQLRSGHCLKLHEYRHRIGIEDSPTCPTCGEEDQDVGHWLLRYPGTLPARQSLFDDLRCIHKFRDTLRKP